jgi:hypothetical protein
MVAVAVLTLSAGFSAQAMTSDLGVSYTGHFAPRSGVEALFGRGIRRPMRQNSANRRRRPQNITDRPFCCIG